MKALNRVAVCLHACLLDAEKVGFFFPFIVGSVAVLAGGGFPD